MKHISLQTIQIMLLDRFTPENISVLEATKIIHEAFPDTQHKRMSKDGVRSTYFCDRIWENPAYCPNAHMAQCAFLVPLVKKCQSPVFVIFMSENLSIILCRHLRRVNVSYQGKTSLHFDLPSLYSCRTRSPLLRALIRIPASGLSGYS